MRKDFLPNAPLKEVLLEIHWDLEYLGEEKILFDKGFEKAVLNFTNSCQQDFKEIDILKPENIPPIAFINRVTHRFYKTKGNHPLYQLGPGVFTVNDNNKNYVWKNFVLMITDGLNCLRSSYEKELIPSRVQLRYIDSVSPYILGETNKFDFLKKHLHISIDDSSFVSGELEDIHLTKSFIIDDSKKLTQTITTGIDKSTREDVIEWHTFISNRKRLSWEGLLDWLEESHSTCSETFKNMISDELYKHFSQ